MSRSKRPTADDAGSGELSEKPEGPIDAPAAPPPRKPDKPVMALFGLDSSADDDQIQDIVNRQVASDVQASGLDQKYNIIILYEEKTLTRSAADRTYTALSETSEDKPLLLILNSPGGDVAAAYLIAKLCREHTKESFEVAVPRRAKSAATLICCGADKIHMGGLSELGPIDPQFGAIPALALKHSIEHIAELAAAYPAATGMFSDYLSKALRIEALGFYERVAESASQYAVRLLNARRGVPKGSNNEATAKRLVYAYKDHGFVIDAGEATEIFGPEIVSTNTDEYRLSNSLLGTFHFVSWICDSRLERDVSYVGGPKQGCWVFKRQE